MQVRVTAPAAVKDCGSRTTFSRGDKLTENPMNRAAALRMIKRRAAWATLPLYLQLSNDLSKSGCDKTAPPEVSRP